MSKFTIALKLFIITAVAAACLALTNSITAPITKANNEKAFNESLRDALPDAKEFESIGGGETAKGSDVKIDSIHAGYKDKEHKELAGYVVKATSPNGYGGDLCVIVGIDRDGKVTKAIISSPFAETAGLGAKAKDADFIDQFKGKSGELNVVKREANGENEISAISSATITSNAVTDCVNAALEASKSSAVSSNSASMEAQKTFTEKKEKSDAELDAVEENRENQPTPTIKKEEDKKKEAENNG